MGWYGSAADSDAVELAAAKLTSKLSGRVPGPPGPGLQPRRTFRSRPVAGPRRHRSRQRLGRRTEDRSATRRRRRAHGARPSAMRRRNPVVERAHQAPSCREASRTAARHAHSTCAELADGHIGSCWQPRKHDVPAEGQSGQPFPADGADHVAASCTSAKLSRSMTWSAIAVSSVVCDTKNSRW